MVNKATKGKGGGFSPPFLQSKSFYWVVLAMSLFLGYLQKSPCFTGSWGAPDSVQYRKLCYSDIQALYGYRGLDQKKLPYVQQKPFEYPPLIGYQMYLSALFSNDHVQFFKVNALFNSLFSILTFIGLIYLVGYSAPLLWYVAAPPLLFHLNINWDISTVFCLVWAIYFWRKEKVWPTAYFVGLGFTGKMFPLFAAPFLALALYQRGEPKKTFLLAFLGFCLGVLTMNLPTLILDLILNGELSAIFGVFGFHVVRTPDFGTFWYWVGEWLGFNPTSKEFTRFVDGSFVVSMCLALLLCIRAQLKERMGPWQAGAVLTAVCLTFSKVHSLQYSLWMLAYFVLLRGAQKSRSLYLFSDLLVFMFGFWWYANFSDAVSSPYKEIFIFGVCLRAVALFSMACSWIAPKKNLERESVNV